MDVTTGIDRQGCFWMITPIPRYRPEQRLCPPRLMSLPGPAHDLEMGYFLNHGHNRTIPHSMQYYLSLSGFILNHMISLKRHGSNAR